MHYTKNKPINTLRCLLLSLAAAWSGQAAAAGADEASPVPAISEASAPDAWSLGLALETRQAVNAHEEHSLAEYSLLTDLLWKPDAEWRMRARARAVSESRLDSTPSRRLRVDEWYLEHKADACGVKAGIQQVVWGQADRLKVVDLIHPLDLRENVFGDPVRSRLPLAMTNLECTFSDQSIQWLVIPSTRRQVRPSSSGRFAVPTTVDSLAARSTMQPDGDEPDWRKPEDWSTGVRWIHRIDTADLALHALYSWQPDPVARLATAGPPRTYQLESERFGMVGLSLAVPVGPVVLKGEWSIVPNADGYYLAGPGLTDSQSVREQRALLAVDYQVDDWFLGAQFFEQRARAAHTPLGGAQQQLITLAVRRDLLQGQMTLSAYLAQDLTRTGQYLTLEGTHQVSDELQFRFGGDYFRGDGQSFGRFHGESRVFLVLRYDIK